MSLIREVGQFINDNGLATIGTDLFVEEMAADPANAVMVLSSSSPEPDQYLNTQTLNFEIWVRNKSTKTGNDLLVEIFTLLHRYHHVTWGDYYVYFIGATGNIENLGKDIENRSLQKINFRAIYKDTRTVS